MGDEQTAPKKPIRDARAVAAASVAPAVAWWPASRLMLDIIKQS
jgi:hypothetical protein